MSERGVEKAYMPDGYTEAHQQADKDFLMGARYGRSVALREAMVALRDRADADVEVALGGVDWVLRWLRERADDLSTRPGQTALTAEPQPRPHEAEHEAGEVGHG